MAEQLVFVRLVFLLRRLVHDSAAELSQSFASVKRAQLGEVLLNAEDLV